MARRDSNKEDTQSKQSKPKLRSDRKNMIAAIIFIVIIVFAIAGALVYGLNNNGSTSLGTFTNNFNSAHRVAIIVTEYNGTQLSATVGCATSLIEQLVAAHGSAHKNATSIDFYIMNRTRCTYSSQLGNPQNNSSQTSTVQQCLTMAQSEPRIFINYSNTNSSRITPQALYVSGNINFLVECGVATELIQSST